MTPASGGVFLLVRRPKKGHRPPVSLWWVALGRWPAENEATAFFTPPLRPQGVRNRHTRCTNCARHSDEATVLATGTRPSHATAGRWFPGSVAGLTRAGHPDLFPCC